MNSRRDKILEIAEELSQTRHQSESMIMDLRTKLAKLKTNIDTSMHELSEKGIDSEFVSLKGLESEISEISKIIRDVKQQSMSLDQALGYIKAAKKIS